MAFRLVLLGVGLLALAAVAALVLAIDYSSLGIAGLGIVLLPAAAMLAWALRVDDVKGSTPLDRHA